MSSKTTLDQWTEAMKRGALVMYRGEIFRIIGTQERPTVFLRPLNTKAGDMPLGLSFSPGTPYADDFLPVPTIEE